jgi:hypothetical protein
MSSMQIPVLVDLSDMKSLSSTSFVDSRWVRLRNSGLRPTICAKTQGSTTPTRRSAVEQQMVSCAQQDVVTPTTLASHTIAEIQRRDGASVVNIVGVVDG